MIKNLGTMQFEACVQTRVYVLPKWAKLTNLVKARSRFFTMM